MHTHTCARLQVHTFSLLSPCCVCVSCLCAFMFFPLLSLGLSAALAPQGMEKEDKHGLMWSNFLPSENEEKKAELKKKTKNILEVRCKM